MSVSISIIMPVYNAEKTLDFCLNSLLKQSENNIQLLVINDCSTDNSLDKINSFRSKFIDKSWAITIISHERNLGVAAARNTGLDHAIGEYIYYVDADDFLEDDALSCMLDKIKGENLDILGFDWRLSFEKNGRYMAQPAYYSCQEAITYMCGGSMRWNLWIFLVRRDLYERHDIRFLSGLNMGEDLYVTIRLFSSAEKVGFLRKALYNYSQSNNESLTKTYSDRHIMEVTKNVSHVEEVLLRKYGTELVRNWVSLLKLNIKLPLLISDKTESYKKWKSWFSEVNNYKNTVVSKRIQLLQYMAYRNQYWFLRLHYYFVIKVVYGMIYK